MLDEVKVLKSIALRGCQKYGNIRRGIKDLISINDYEADAKSNESTGDLLEKYVTSTERSNQATVKQFSDLTQVVRDLKDEVQAMKK